eukprot:8004942-Pyramimonas_sp.AAC.1
MALRRPGGDDLNPDRGPMKRYRRCAPGAPAGSTAKAAPKPKPETIELPSSFDSDSGSIRPSLGPDHPGPKKKKKRKSPDDSDPGAARDMRGNLPSNALIDNDLEG